MKINNTNEYNLCLYGGVKVKENPTTLRTFINEILNLNIIPECQDEK